MALFSPANAPLWLKDFSRSVERAFREIWPSPFRPQQLATTDLPTASDHKGGIVYDLTLNKLKYSNATTFLTLVDLGGGTFTGAISAPSLTITGVGGQIVLNDRDGTGSWTIYNDGNTIKLNDGSDRHTFAQAAVSFNGSLSCTDGLTAGNAAGDAHSITGVVTHSGRYSLTNGVAGTSAAVFEGVSGAGVIIDSAGGGDNYIDSTNLNIRTIAGVAIASFSSGAASITGSLSCTTTFSCNGVATLGDNIADSHTVNGALLVTSSNGNVASWGAGQVRVATAGGTTEKAAAISVDTTNNRCTLTALQPGTAWLGQDFRANEFIFYQGGATQAASVTSTGVQAVGSFKPSSYTVAGVPSAATHGAGAMIYVSNEAGGAVIAFSDGASWRRVTDRAVIS